ncbi:MAG: ASKHA domain-containing protein [Planctomycetota bacterium]|jgi:uncharacterized 2Fe-2S/4Fe-4S cluster protein (DUF4445 family)
MRITFLPDGETVESQPGESLLDGARKGQVFVHSPCGGVQTCGKCKVRVQSGEVKREPTRFLDVKAVAAGLAMACSTFPESDVVVEIPPEARGLPGQIAAARREDPTAKPLFDPGPLPYLTPDPVFRQSPLATRVFCPLSPPDRKDAISDLDRLRRCLNAENPFERIYTDIDVVRTLPHVLREAGYQVTVTLGKRGGRSAEILSLSPGNVADRNFGAAVDVGTTTLVVHIVDLSTGETVGRAASLNSQARFGDDVITRIFHAGRPGGLVELQETVVQDLNRLLKAACREAEIETGDVSCMQVAANTTMTQILLNVDPAYIRKEPYVATANFFPQVQARSLGLAIHPAAMVSTVPGVASYVGGDVVAGVVACGMATREAVTLFIDLGTNGEMVLGNREWLACTSCSVGPAFEGSGITHGTRAGPGAIQEVELSDGGERLAFSTIGDAEVTGICGSGLIDLLAGLRGAGVLDRSGRFQEGEAPTRLRKGPEGLEYVVSRGADREILLTQPDVDNLVRSKAAVYAACSLLVKRMGLTFDELDQVIIAGGFGNYLDIDRAVRIGLLPDQPREKFVFVGNSSLAGAKIGLRFESARDHARKVNPMMTYIELSGDNAYHEEFVSALFLPHTDLSLFPSQGE